MSSAFEKLKRQVIGLPADQKQELLAVLQSTLQFSKRTVAQSKAQRVEDYLFDYLTDAVKRFCLKRGLVTRGDANLAMKRTIERLTKYPQDNEMIRRWIEEKIEPQTEAEKQHVADIFVQTLYTHLNHSSYYREHGIGPHELLINIRRIPTAVDGELPGYAANGLLKLLVRR